MLNEAGFANVELVRETGFNSSVVTKGALFRARKSEASDVGRVEMEQEDIFSKYRSSLTRPVLKGRLTGRRNT